MTSADALVAVLARAEALAWAGPDPYDGLASSLGGAVIRLGAFPRFALSQVVLRFPFIRALTKPHPTVNAKGLALFMGAVARGRHLLGVDGARSICESLRDEIEGLAIRADGGLGWGYPFPWQSRSFWAPVGTANAVVTATVGWQMLEMADAFGDERAREIGRSAAAFLASELNQSQTGAFTALSYTRSDRTRVVNISALASRLIARAAHADSSPELSELAERLARFVLQEQRENGSWPYSSDPGGGWEDSFHTGYVLEALLDVRGQGIRVPDEALTRGFAAYARFFDTDGGARLYSSPSSSLDAHSAAQGVITYAALDSSSACSVPTLAGAEDKAIRIASWAKRALWLPAKGHFAYRINGGRRDEREFTRWVQAWMALAMATVGALEMRLAVPNGQVNSAGIA